MPSPPDRDRRRVGSERIQAEMVLRWFCEDAAIRILAADAKLAILTVYRYFHEAVDVIAKQAPDLHAALDRAKREGCSHLMLGRTFT
jgi:hypothetical protein